MTTTEREKIELRIKNLQEQLANTKTEIIKVNCLRTIEIYQKLLKGLK